MPAISFNNVFFSYDKPVLEDATFSVAIGETVGLIGDNGSGKSTIAKICTAGLSPASGRAEVLGENISHVVSSGREPSLRQHIGTVLQNPDDQIVSSLVIDEVAFGPGNLGLSRKEVIRRVDSALAKVGMLEHVGSNVNTLSGGQRQRIAIADALAMEPELLILDEVTSMLDLRAKHELLDLIQSLRDEGMTILMITHSLDEALICDRVLEVKDGHVLELANADEVADRLSCDRVLRALERTSPTPPGSKSQVQYGGGKRISSRRASKAAVEFDRVSFTYSRKDERGTDIFNARRSDAAVFSDLSLEVNEGESLAIIGSNGSGKSTLLKLMCALLAPTSGKVSVCGMPTLGKEGANHARRHVGISFQYPERSIFCSTVYDEVAFGPRNLGLGEEEVELRVARCMEGVGLSFAELRGRNPHALSGGEQRKVSLAGVLAMQPEILALDEPCAGLDAPSRLRFWKMMEGLKGEGQTVVLVTHDLREAEFFADRVLRLD